MLQSFLRHWLSQVEIMFMQKLSAVSVTGPDLPRRRTTIECIRECWSAETNDSISGHQFSQTHQTQRSRKRAVNIPPSPHQLGVMKSMQVPPTSSVVSGLSSCLPFFPPAILWTCAVFVSGSFTHARRSSHIWLLHLLSSLYLPD